MAPPSKVDEAKQYLRDGDKSTKEAVALAKALLALDQISYARRVLACAALDPQGEQGDLFELWEKYALAMSKDLDLPPTRHAAALRILEEHADLATTTSPETLGIAGGILKRRWESDGNVRHLERSLGYYRRGYAAGIAADDGYTAINAAFLLDLLAALDAEDAKAAGVEPAPDDPRRGEADGIRREIVDVLPSLPGTPGNETLDQEWWFHSTLAEAYFGLGDYAKAKASLETANACHVEDWKFQSTIGQLAMLAQLRAGSVGRLDRDAFEASEPAGLVAGFLGPARAEAALSARLGKVGLALSGGGFRASLFHIGVLAKLAELDVLRRVEVLSCVSGGSIVGAHYYLKVRELLQRKPDEDVTQQDYIDLVQELAQEFVDGVQSNIRARGAVNPLTHLITIFSPDHTTRTVGKLFERKLYSKVADGEADVDRYLTDLFVRPKGDRPDFQPKRHNWLRRSKVPVLVLNATSLNTGHNWQFTASWMGEPPSGAENPVDRNDILRRMWYSEAPPKHRRIRLGHAVAASASVPGLFSPVVLHDLYGQVEGTTVPMNVKLVDGGVHDNQGIASLIEQSCSVMLVSDASGQMGTKEDPAAGLAAVPMRTSSILMARVRGAQYDDLVARLNASVLRGLMFVHLKQELQLRVVDWTDSDDPTPTSPLPETSYGISRAIQKRLSDVRTDLDAFHDAEAFALMTSGYKITASQFDKSLSDFPTSRVDVQWPFLAVEPLMHEHVEDRQQLDTLLEVAAERFLKNLRLSQAARLVALLTLVVIGAAVVYAFWRWRGATLLTVGVLGLAVLAYSLLSVASKRLGRLRLRETLARGVIESLLVVVAPIVFGLHLLFANRRYLARGRVTTHPDGAVTIGPRGREAPGPAPEAGAASDTGA